MILQASTLLLLQLKQASTVLVANYQVPNSNNWAGINSHDCYHRLDFYAASPALPIAINVAVAFFGGAHQWPVQKNCKSADLGAKELSIRQGYRSPMGRGTFEGDMCPAPLGQWIHLLIAPTGCNHLHAAGASCSSNSTCRHHYCGNLLQQFGSHVSWSDSVTREYSENDVKNIQICPKVSASKTTQWPSTNIGFM